MKNKIQMLLLLLVSWSVSTFAQTDKEERDERKAKAKDRVDYNVFRRQMLASKEYSEERHKVPGLQRNTKEAIKVVAYVDSMADDDTKLLTGYISVNVGDNSTNVYEMKYDRLVKKITTVKATGEMVEIEADETPTAKKAASKSPATKKKATDDEEDDEEEEDKKPTRGKKEKDEE